jgi:TetR/AcrR family transcriptional regulator, transcriptional repressor for nem operon
MARNVEFNEEEAIQKAMEVFWKKGYSGASLRDLTDAMKINSSSLYNTIGDKHELFVKCIKNYTETRMEEVKRRAAGAQSPLAAIISFINDAVTVIINGDSCMAINTAFEIAATDKAIQDILKADNDFIQDFLISQLAKAMEQGEISSDEEPELLADYFMSTWTGWYESYLLHKDPIKISRMAQYFIKQLSK